MNNFEVEKKWEMVYQARAKWIHFEICVSFNMCL